MCDCFSHQFRIASLFCVFHRFRDGGAILFVSLAVQAAGDILTPILPNSLFVFFFPQVRAIFLSLQLHEYQTNLLSVLPGIIYFFCCTQMLIFWLMFSVSPFLIFSRLEMYFLKRGKHFPKERVLVTDIILTAFVFVFFILFTELATHSLIPMKTHHNDTKKPDIDNKSLQVIIGSFVVLWAFIILSSLFLYLNLFKFIKKRLGLVPTLLLSLLFFIPFLAVFCFYSLDLMYAISARTRFHFSLDSQVCS